MRRIIEELNTEHAKIAGVLLEAKAAGVATPHGRELLNSAKTLLLFHLKKEDSELYPELKIIATGDEELKKILDKFADDMENVTKTVFRFFDKHFEGTAGTGIETDFEELFSVLAQRIRREETVLYPSYERFIKDKSLPSIQEILQDFSDVEGFDSVGIFTPDGELVVKYGPDEKGLSGTGSLANRMLNILTGYEGGDDIGSMIHIEGKGIHVFMKCFEKASESVETTRDKVHIHLVSVIASDSGVDSARNRMKTVFPALVEKFRT